MPLLGQPRWPHREAGPDIWEDAPPGRDRWMLALFAARSRSSAGGSGAAALARATAADRRVRRFADRRLRPSPPTQAFPAKLERRSPPRASTSEVANAGVSGDTAAGGLARLDWSVPDGTDAVILELGANDALRGVDPKVTREALDAMLRGSRRAPDPGAARRHAGAAQSGRRTMGAPSTPSIPISPRNTAPSSIRSSSTASPADPKLNQRDGLHPTAAGVDVIVAQDLPRGRAAARPRCRTPNGLRRNRWRCDRITSRGESSIGASDSVARRPVR